MTWFDDLLRARDVNVDDPSSTWPLDVLAYWWRSEVDYQWDGRGHRILDVAGCWERGYGSCGDAAASLLAAARRQGLRDAWLCIEEPIVPGYPEYKHVRAIVGGLAYDPYSFTRPRGLPMSCEKRVIV